MTAALLLYGFAAAVCVGAPKVLRRARFVDRAPRLGLAAWCAAALAVVAALAPAGVVLAASAGHMRDAVCAMWTLCLDTMRGEHGPSGQILAAAGLLLTFAVLARLLAAAVRLGRATAGMRRRHAAMLTAVGRTVPALHGVTLVDHGEPAAYLVPGRQSTVVVTSGALDRLSAGELDAVLAHERAHAAGRHHRLVDAALMLCRAFPGIALFTQAHEQIRRLVEVCADDAAARSASRLDLARALVAMAALAVPDAVVAANGGDAVARVRRLLQPPARLRWPATVGIVTALVTLPLLPLSVAVLAPVVPALAGCPHLV